MTTTYLSEDVMAKSSRVARMLSVVKCSGAAEMLACWRDADRESSGRMGKGGMPPWLTDEAVLTALLLVTATGHPQTVDAMASLIVNGLDRKGLRMLGVDPKGLKPREARERVSRSYHRVLDVLDPHPGNKKLLMTRAEFREYEASLDPDVVARRMGRLHELTNALVIASVKQLPKQYLDRWNGNCCVDATFVPLHAARGTKVRDPHDDDYVSIEGFGDWWVRPDDHQLTEAMLKSSSKTAQRAVREARWGLELTTILAGSDDPGRKAAFPLLCVGISFDKPGHAPGPNAISALSRGRAAGFPAGTLAGDRAYGYRPLLENFAGPAREMGFKLVWEIDEDDLAKPQMLNGAVILEGNLYCASILRNERLVNATRDYRVGDLTTGKRLTKEEWKAAIRERAQFLLKPHGRMEPNGCQRMRCPASGDAPTVRCPLRLRDDDKVASLKEVKKSDLPRKVDRSGLCNSMGGSTTMKPNDVYPRYVQDLQYGSDAWEAAYGRMRQTVESFNNQVKDGAFTALRAADRRRVRGFAAQYVCVAMIVAAANLRKIDRWLANPVTLDAEGKAPLYERKPRRREEIARRNRERRKAQRSAPPDLGAAA